MKWFLKSFEFKPERSPACSGKVVDLPSRRGEERVNVPITMQCYECTTVITPKKHKLLLFAKNDRTLGISLDLALKEMYL